MNTTRLPFALAAAVLAYAVCLFAPRVLADGDSFTHVAAGQWMLAHGAVPAVDPFSATFGGQPWMAHEWLAELLMGSAYRLGGWDGVLALTGLAAALGFGLFAWHLGRWLQPVPAACAFILGAACVGPEFLARPHILALPALELWTAGLLIARERRRIPWALLPVMTLWANLHDSFLFGIALAAAFAAEAVLEAGRAWLRTALAWAAFGAASLGAAMVSPHGWKGVVFPILLTSMSQLGHIGEWQLTDLSQFQLFEPGLAVALYVCVTRRLRLGAWRILVLGGLVFMALSHVRHQMLLGFVGALVFAASLPLPRPVAGLAPGRLRALAIACAAALLLTAGRAAAPKVIPDGPSAPVTALAHVPAALAARPVLNDYAFGSYLIFNGIRPYVDSRAELYGDAFLIGYGALTDPDGAALHTALAGHDIAWVLAAPASDLTAAMDGMSGWRRIYADATAVVFARTDQVASANLRP